MPHQCCTEMTHRIFEGRRRSITDAGSALSKQRRNSWAGNVSGEVLSWPGWRWFTDWLFSSENIFLDVITALQPSLTISSAAPTLIRIFPAAIIFHYCSPSFKAASPQPSHHHILQHSVILFSPQNTPQLACSLQHNFPNAFFNFIAQSLSNLTSKQAIQCKTSEIIPGNSAQMPNTDPLLFN